MDIVRANVLVGPRHLRMREFPRPRIGTDDALLRVEACGICGSDVDAFRDGLESLGVAYPVVPGHEAVGVIDEIGPLAARRWRVAVGDRVALEPAMRCGFCPPCIAGDYQLCSGDRPGRAYGYTSASVAPAVWGGFSDYLYLGATALVHRVPDHVPAGLAVLFNALGGAVSWAVHRPRLARGDTLVIFGPGQRGLCAVVAARDAGAGTVIVAGTAQDARRLALALDLGADVAVTAAGDELVDIVAEATSGRMADVVLDVSSGATQPVVDAVRVARRGGKVVLAGLKSGAAVPGLVSDELLFKQLTVTGVMSVGQQAYADAIRIIASGEHPLHLLVSHRYPVDQADLAIRVLAREQTDGDEPLFVALSAD